MPSFFRAGGMNRADEGLAICGDIPWRTTFVCRVEGSLKFMPYC